MIKTARQLKDLIRNLSKKNAADAQILMRNYMMERFLERISLSSYRDKFILKGGMLVAAMVGLDARSTMDLDATVKGANISVEDVENMIAEIIAVPIDDGVTIRLNFPAPNEERRKQLAKEVSKLGEDAKIAVRNVRRDAMDKAKAMKKAGELTEDTQKTMEEDVQKLTDKYIKNIDAAVEEKQKEIMAV